MALAMSFRLLQMHLQRHRALELHTGQRKEAGAVLTAVQGHRTYMSRESNIPLQYCSYLLPSNLPHERSTFLVFNIQANQVVPLLPHLPLPLLRLTSKVLARVQCPGISVLYCTSTRAPELRLRHAVQYEVSCFVSRFESVKSPTCWKAKNFKLVFAQTPRAMVARVDIQDSSEGDSRRL